MTILLRLRRDLFDAVHADLHRPHRFADERVGFLYGPIALLSARCALVLPTRYEPVPDEDYLDDPTVGACINTDAMRRAVRTTLASGACCFHVHVHDHNGAPYPSGVDQALVRRFTPALHAVAPAARHGGIVLSRDAATTIVWSHTTQQLEHARVSIVGAPMWIGAGERDGDSWLIRGAVGSRSWGDRAAEIISRCKVGVVGLGGGGSHIVQQLAHVGFEHFVPFDPDRVEDHNLNRLVGATTTDAVSACPKTEIAERVIRGLIASPDIDPNTRRWQERPEALQACDLIFGCLDGLEERAELEACARRYLIPYIDIGLTVRVVADEAPQMSGQIVLTTPGSPCLRCLRIITEASLAEEAAEYGDAGIRPQVVWANGVLASTAVGLAVELLTGWTRSRRTFAYLQYDGNLGTVVPHPRLAYLTLPEHCPHFLVEEVGPVCFTPL